MLELLVNILGTAWPGGFEMDEGTGAGVFCQNTIIKLNDNYSVFHAQILGIKKEAKIVSEFCYCII